jgi:chemotaxis protein CheZ
MMAQDFQDLSGQVIKKVIDIINRTELQLVQLLIDSAPNGDKKAVAEFTGETHQLQGPQANETALAQGDVDDLLASLGF